MTPSPTGQAGPVRGGAGGRPGVAVRRLRARQQRRRGVRRAPDKPAGAARGGLRRRGRFAAWFRAAIRGMERRVRARCVFRSEERRVGKECRL